MSIGEFFKAVFRMTVIATLTAVVILSAFGVGYLLRAVQTTEVAAAVPTPEIVLTDEDAPSEFDVFWEAWAFVEERFYGEVPSEQERVYGAIRGMVNTFGDQNTAFIEPSRAAIFREDSTGSFEGIGATVRLDEMGRLYIAEPFAGRPAAEAGLLQGDVVLEVDGVSILGMSLYEAISLIRGPADSTVVLTIFRDGVDEPFEVPIVRARIEIEVVESERLEDDIGYVSLSEFSRGASVKVGDAIEALEAEGELKGLILDLRNNPGGLLDEAIFVGNQFIDEGMLTIERQKDGPDQVFEAQAGGVAIRVQGLRRYYALTVGDDGVARLVKELDGTTVLAEASYPWTPGDKVMLSLEAKGSTLTGTVGAQTVLQANDETFAGGAAALLCEEGTIGADQVTVRPS